MAETMQHATSPQLKHVQATNVADSFTDGLVGPLSNDSNVAQVDTFIEKPFCTHNLKVAQTVTDQEELESDIQLKIESATDFQLEALQIPIIIAVGIVNTFNVFSTYLNLQGICNA